MFNALLALTRICPEHLAQLLRAMENLERLSGSDSLLEAPMVMHILD